MGEILRTGGKDRTRGGILERMVKERAGGEVLLPLASRRHGAREGRGFPIHRSPSFRPSGLCGLGPRGDLPRQRMPFGLKSRLVL
jgi:hypothetical protein